MMMTILDTEQIIIFLNNKIRIFYSILKTYIVLSNITIQ